MHSLRTWKEMRQEQPSSRGERSLDDFFREEASDSRIVVDKLMRGRPIFDIETLRRQTLKLTRKEASRAEKQGS